MAISAVSSGSAVAAQTPPVQPQQAKAPVKAPVADTVTISKQAQQLVSDGDTAAQEAKESAAEQASERLKGKK